MRNLIRTCAASRSEVFELFNPLSPSVDFPQLFNRNEKPTLGPYCGKVEP